jgi:predicted nucleic acid-binding protein
MLSAYDATYLELAFRYGAPIASFDIALNSAARSEGVVSYIPFANDTNL